MRLSRIAQMSALVLLCGAVGGCNINDLTNLSDAVDGGVVNVGVVESAEGARLVYLGGIDLFAQLFARNAIAVSRFTDELSLKSGVQTNFDARLNQDGGGNGGVTVENLFVSAQSAKVQLEQALQLLREYSGDAGHNMEAHTLGMLGMVHIFMADNFCSGIPLSESKWGGEFTPGRGYPADSLYERAIQLFDAGIALDPDSAAVKTLLLVGKARALNALGRWSEAAQVASQVATTDSVWIQFGPAQYLTTPPPLPAFRSDGAMSLDSTNYVIVNGKGNNGLDWITADPQKQDDRIQIRTANGAYVSPWKPRFIFENRTIVIAGGAEARLIEAEFHLQQGETGEFLNKINEVRRLYKTYDGTPLADTTDPGTEAGRVNLLFRERAYTFYVSGRRLGDFRRLVRQYGRAPQDVYPTGAIPGPLFLTYGDNFVFAPEVPGSGTESQNNQFYYQCDDYAP